MSLRTDDLASGLLTILLVLAIAGAVAAVTITRARRRGSTTLALDVTDRLSSTWIFLCGAGALLAVASTLVSRSLTLDEPVRSQLLASPDLGSCDFAWATQSPAADCYGSVIDAPAGARVLVLLGILLTLASSAALAWAIGTAARRAASGDAFHASVSRTFSWAGLAFLAAATAGALVHRIGTTLAARSVPGAEVAFHLEVPLWPFAVALGCLALAAIFRHGERLQREIEGLV